MKNGKQPKFGLKVLRRNYPEFDNYRVVIFYSTKAMSKIIRVYHFGCPRTLSQYQLSQ